ncbi:hypothetical protein CDQ91_06935 [Sphingopyxis witflariensis]|uniref:Uncharacterized protein n=2 Tax=Sphingopyxis witflariensis TaxID=173675 RepID=A0A246JYG7_9SPHN|nr:hypothetical protein CDQ91_06935 [Sphingopyxis witflariensis]
MDLSQVTQRTANQSRGRLVDRRASILPARRDTRAPELRPSGDMRSASRGDVGGAEALMRTLGMVTDAAKDFQSYAGNKFAKDESANAARGMADQAADNVDPELARKSAAYTDSVARGRTASAWHDYALEMDEELNALVENQQQLTVEERRDEFTQFLNDKYRAFAINDETGQLQDFLATPGAMRYLGEKMTQTRGVVAAEATKRIEDRFNVEALGHFTKNIRDQSKFGAVDFTAALALIPPTIPDNVKRAAIKDTVIEIVSTLKDQDREVDARQLLDSVLEGGFEIGVGGSTDQTAIDAMRGPVAVDIPASDVAPPAAPAAPAYSRTALKAKIRGPESGGDDTATNGMGSSASGRYQFVEGTFKQLYKRVYGATSSQARDAWDSKKFDVGIQEKLMDALIADNEAALATNRLPITDGNMYVMHVLGSGDGPRFLKAPANSPVADILSAQIVRQNPTYFGGGKTVGQAYARIAAVVGGAADGAAVDPVADDPSYISPGRDLSPLEQYLQGPRSAATAPVMTGGLAWTQQERNSLLEIRRSFTETAIADWHKKRADQRSDNAHGMMMRVFGQGAAITSQDVTDSAERGDIDEPDAITLYRMLRDDAAQKRAEADRATREQRETEAVEVEEQVEAVTARIMAPVYTGKRRPEDARSMMLHELAKLSPKVARRALAEMTPTLGALENAGEQTPQARNAMEMMDGPGRAAFINAVVRDARPSSRKAKAAKASSFVDQAIQRAQRAITRGTPPDQATAEAREWLTGKIPEFGLRRPRRAASGSPAEGLSEWEKAAHSGNNIWENVTGHRW